MQISYIGLFLQYKLDEVLIARRATNLFYRSLVERVHSIANLGLQSTRLIGKPRSENMKKIICSAKKNSSKLVTELKKSRDQPKNLMEEVFKELSLKDTLTVYFW